MSSRQTIEKGNLNIKRNGIFQYYGMTGESDSKMNIIDLLIWIPTGSFLVFFITVDGFRIVHRHIAVTVQIRHLKQNVEF